LIYPEGIRQAGKNLVSTGMNILKTFLDSEHFEYKGKRPKRGKNVRAQEKKCWWGINSYTANPSVIREGNEVPGDEEAVYKIPGQQAF